jgi:hypothetical protein
MMEYITSIFRIEKQMASRAARDGTLHKNCCENLKSYIQKMFRSPYSHWSDGGQRIFIKEFH